MKKISEPQVKVIKFENVDVIATSPDILLNDRAVHSSSASIDVQNETGDRTWF